MKMCLICGQELTIQKKYCSRECQYKSYKKRKSNWVIRTCENCGNEFDIKESSLKYGRGRCCSRKCVDENKKKTYLGKNNPMYGKICSDNHRRKQSEHTSRLWKTREFRDKVRRGQVEYLKTHGHWPGTDDCSKESRKKTLLDRYGIEHNWNGKFGTRNCDTTTIELYGKSSIDLMNEALFSTKYTSIEIIVEEILRNNCFKYIRNYKIVYDEENVKYKVYDFYLTEYNILIEADGDYWHGNPKLFNKLNKTQQRNVENDQFKNKLADDCGYVLLRFWESEINSTEFEHCFLEVINEQKI